MLDKTCNIARTTLDWLAALDDPPVSYIAEDRIRVATTPMPYLEFGFHSSGSDAEIQVGDERVRSAPGTLIVLNAHFGNFGTPKKAWRFWCLSLDVAETSPAPHIARAPFLAAAPVSNPLSVVARYQDIAREYARPGPAQAVRLKGALLLLLAELLEGLSSDEIGPPNYSPQVETAICFLRNDHRNPRLNLNAVARYAHLSEAHLGRIFRQEVGASPMRYLREVRLRRARELLTRTRLTIGEIAREVGFEDPAYFSRVFKTCGDGIGPRAWRRAHTERPRATVSDTHESA